MQHLFLHLESFQRRKYAVCLENRRKNSQIISDNIRLLFYFSFILLQEPLWLVPLLGPSLKAALLVLSPNEIELDL
jgi:hypothetical protein